MRLSEIEKKSITSHIRKHMQDASIYLFGSRIDDNKKGGDIDILVLAPTKLVLRDKIDIKLGFYKDCGEQKIDIVSYTFDEQDSFKRAILGAAKQLI
jgi:predicted nucleotidyltransferase